MTTTRRDATTIDLDLRRALLFLCAFVLSFSLPGRPAYKPRRYLHACCCRIAKCKYALRHTAGAITTATIISPPALHEGQARSAHVLLVILSIIR